MIQIIADSTAYLSQEELTALGVQRVPLNIHFLGEVFPDMLPGDFDAFYHKLSTVKEFPSTSQPAVGAFMDAYEPALAQGDEVLVLAISSKLSGTVQSAQMAADMTQPDKVTVVDTLSSASAFRFLIEIAAQMRDEGATREQIRDRILERTKDTITYLTVGNLEYLRRGGRLSNAQAVIGSLLDFKPIISFKDGVLKAIDKVRGKNKASARLIELVPKEVTKLQVLHIFGKEEAEAIRTELMRLHPHAEHLPVGEIGPVLGCHLGPGALGVACIC